VSVWHAVARLRNYATIPKVADSIPDESFQRQSFRPHYGSEADSTSNRYKDRGDPLGEGGGRRVVQPSCADCPEILGALTS